MVVPVAYREPSLAARIALISECFLRLLGRPLVPDSADPVAALWHAEVPVVAHGTEADPVFFFGNKAALEAFETKVEDFTRMPSRLSAEAPLREERQALMEQVAARGFIDDYRGVRISAKGRRFMMTGGIVWNLTSADGIRQGQAATFNPAPI